MDTFYNWHQIRGLIALAVLGLFVVYVLLVAMWQTRKTRRMTEQDPSLPVPQTFSGEGNGRIAETQAWRSETPASDPARRAA